MPKDRRLNFLSSDRARASPYACSSKDSNHNKWEGSLLPVGDEKEWEEARCPICMEHPHNAVLLLCSSRDKGCRPYMCDTSHRLSNCLDQFCKSVAGASSTELQEDVTVSRMQYTRGRAGQRLLRPTRSTERQVPELLCPLCRGQISGWVVIENARCYMNSKVRSCSLESCNFTGNYTELRKHARCEHPTVKPSDVDPHRQSEWVRLEHERDLGDTLSAVQSQFGYDPYADYSLSEDWISDINIPDDTEAEWSEEEWSDDGNISVDFDVGITFTFSFLNDFSFGPLEGERNFSSPRSLNRRFVRSRSRANRPGGVSSPRRRNPTPAGSVSEGWRNIGSERTGGGSLDRRSMRSRSRSNPRVDITFPRRWDTAPSRSGQVGMRNTDSERTGGQLLGRRSMRPRSRLNRGVELTSPRRWDSSASRFGSGRARNTVSARIGGRSFGRGSIASRSRPNHRGEINSRRLNTTSPGSSSWQYAE